MYKTGYVTELDAQMCRVRVKFEDADEIVSPLLPVLQKQAWQNKDYWMPEINDYVACLLDENGESGIVLGAIYTDERTPVVADVDVRKVVFADGTSVTYDRGSHSMTVDCVGDVTVKSAEKVTIDAPASEVTGTLTIKGLTTMEGGFVGKGGGAVSGKVEGVLQATSIRTDSGIDMEEHKHGGVESGTKTSGPAEM